MTDFCMKGGIGTVNLNLRRSGILMPLFSLPGSTGIGTMGEISYSFVDILKKSGQTYWQLLPLGVTDKTNSPYQCFSSFAGNPFYIDLDFLRKDGYINKRDYANIFWGNAEERVDYKAVSKGRAEIFKKVYRAFLKNIPEDFYEFESKNDFWLSDYALFMAIREVKGDKFLFSSDNKELKNREKSALRDFEKYNSDGILYHKMLQYFFFKQWYDLKKYANDKGIYIIGDLPYYVSSNSADVWKNKECFCLDEDFNIKYVAGCPPDEFSEEGQLWGNVVYNNDYIIKNGYKFWLKRFGFSKDMYDVIRIDHFKAFESYYVIEAEEKTAKNGKWLDGAGYDFFRCMKENIGEVPVIAEDLGYKTEKLKKLLSDCGFRGMKILQFAFDSDWDNEYLPHNCTEKSVVYTGTHDNDTTLGYILSSDKDKIKKAKEYFRTRKTTLLLKEFIIAAMSSVSDICIIPLQDLIGLDSTGRINTPSTVGSNWQWRCTHEQLKNTDFETFSRYTKLYGRHF